MSRFIAPDQWVPIDVGGLEPAAEQAVRSPRNTLVIAGPGAGKTELLAQRACYLLQTRICPPPRRILAISFKRDSARNLEERVLRRCGVDLAERFDSLTFDAFAKSLLDRFWQALPAQWRPTEDYEVSLTDITADKLVQRIREAKFDASRRNEALRLWKKDKDALYETFLNAPCSSAPSDAASHIAAELWRHFLFGKTKACLNFAMIGRLAELIIRSNRQIRNALKSTYSFVFLDEFQDTTDTHYRLTRAIFEKSLSTLTAVGDNKQRIMGWAGALDGIFQSYQKDFGTSTLRLVRNYRSAPRLVSILGFLAVSLDPKASPAEAVDSGADGKGECRVLLYPDARAEAAHLASMIQTWIVSEGLKPRDICILTRMRSEDYARELHTCMKGKGLKLRSEIALQDLLADPLISCLTAFLKLGAALDEADSWSVVVDLMMRVRGIDCDLNARRLERELRQKLKKFRAFLNKNTLNIKIIEQIVKEWIRFIGIESVSSLFPQYQQGDYLTKQMQTFVAALTSAAERHSSWKEALIDFEGTDSVPVMTLHKSKGLEYHTVVFVGLEDAALFSYAAKPAEETCGFFVAFSRAKKRVYFTFSEERIVSPSRGVEEQSRRQISPLYALLQKAGVAVEIIDPSGRPERFGAGART